MPLDGLPALSGGGITNFSWKFVMYFLASTPVGAVRRLVRHERNGLDLRGHLRARRQDVLVVGVPHERLHRGRRCTPATRQWPKRLALTMMAFLPAKRPCKRTTCARPRGTCPTL